MNEELADFLRWTIADKGEETGFSRTSVLLWNA
jgi:hypothetical protein